MIFNRYGIIDTSLISDDDIAALPEDQQHALITLMEINDEAAIASAALDDATIALKAATNTLRIAEKELAVKQPPISEVAAIKDHIAGQQRINMARRGQFDALDAFDASRQEAARSVDVTAEREAVEKAAAALDLRRVDEKAAKEKLAVMRRRQDMAVVRYQSVVPKISDREAAAAVAAAFVPNGPNAKRPPDGRYAKLRAPAHAKYLAGKA